MDKAIYAGSFDPVTNGHIDLVKRGLYIFDNLILAVAGNPHKNPLFSVEERVEMLKNTVGRMDGVEVDSFSGLLVDYASKKRIKIVLRGLRAVSDFEMEFQMALTNRRLNEKVETIFMMPKADYSFLSSRTLKEIVSLGGDVSKFVPLYVQKRLKEKCKRSQLTVHGSRLRK